MAQEAVDGLRKQRQEPSVEVERARCWQVRLAPLEREARPVVSLSLDTTGAIISGFDDEDAADPVSRAEAGGK
jgi:hypothetical protein